MNEFASIQKNGKIETNVARMMKKMTRNFEKRLSTMSSPYSSGWAQYFFMKKLPTVRSPTTTIRTHAMDSA